MSREEAIKILYQYSVQDMTYPKEDIEAFELAIQALEEQENPNSIRINFVGEKEAEEFKECLKNQQESCEDMGEVSDGYHTFNQLYHQRAVLFATIVNSNKDKAWKSLKHSDGKYCFDSNGEWFIVGVDTPQGSYTYHYEKKYWDMFDCKELQCGKKWDGHTEEDVTRLLSLEQEPILDKIRTGWILVSERLPEEGTWNIFTDGKRLSIERYKHDALDHFWPDGRWFSFDEVVAWMPLPERYKEDEEE